MAQWGAIAGWSFVGIFLIWLAVLLIRAWRFRPADESPIHLEKPHLDEKKIIADLADMIRCRTLSSRDESEVETGEFQRFRELLAERFPGVSAACVLEHIGKNGLLYRWPGKNDNQPAVLMAHYDVVPAEAASWTRPAFTGLIEDNQIWGRGTLDTKGTLCGIMEAAEQLIQQGFLPEQDIYLSFSGEEEIDGDTCAEIVATLESRGVKPAFVLDEGGAVVEKPLPGVLKPCAMVGIAEKGSVSLELSLQSPGGHASTPPPHTIVGRLARAAVRIENHPFRAQLTRPVRDMFATLGKHASPAFRILYANLWCFWPLLSLAGRKTGGELNAMQRTTCAMTRMSGSKAYNVLPSQASIGANLRLLGADTLNSVQARLTQIIDDEQIQIRLVSGMNPSIVSDTRCDAWNNLKQIISGVWPEAVVSPYLMLGCSDSRHYCRITDRVYRFAPMALTKAERATIHGHDERIPIPTLLKTVEFYVHLIRTL